MTVSVSPSILHHAFGDFFRPTKNLHLHVQTDDAPGGGVAVRWKIDSRRERMITRCCNLKTRQAADFKHGRRVGQTYSNMNPESIWAMCPRPELTFLEVLFFVHAVRVGHQSTTIMSFPHDVCMLCCTNILGYTTTVIIHHYRVRRCSHLAPTCLRRMDS